jgi:hypothetical protein
MMRSAKGTIEYSTYDCDRIGFLVELHPKYKACEVQNGLCEIYTCISFHRFTEAGFIHLPAGRVAGAKTSTVDIVDSIGTASQTTGNIMVDTSERICSKNAGVSGVHKMRCLGRRKSRMMEGGPMFVMNAYKRS